METKQKKHRWLTVTTPKDTTPSELVSCMQIHMGRSYSSRIRGYTFEFTGKDMQYHPHIHILYDNHTQPQKSQLLRDLAKDFKVLPNFVENCTEGIKSSKRYFERINYLKGEKKESKIEMVNKDNQIREENNIKNYYLM